MKTFKLTISSPVGDVFSDDITKISLRGTEGDFAIMAGHVPFVTTIKPGECKIELENGKEKTGTAESGILTVTKDGVTLLSGSFKWK
jgi:F-type H+-transporting ATPase subunit epsilon